MRLESGPDRTESGLGRDENHDPVRIELGPREESQAIVRTE